MMTDRVLRIIWRDDDDCYEVHYRRDNTIWFGYDEDMSAAIANAIAGNSGSCSLAPTPMHQPANPDLVKRILASVMHGKPTPMIEPIITRRLG